MAYIIKPMASRYLRDEEGSVFILVAVAAFMLITVTGVAVDTAREEMLQQKISSALDAAGLAAGATASSINVQTQAQKYFNANFPAGYMGSSSIVVTATPNDNDTVISLTATGTQATTFLQAVGINSVNVAVSSQVTRANEGMELVLVLDNTGSMAYPVNPADSSTTKIQALQSAAAELMNILYGSSTAVNNLWVGLVPFSQAVNIGPGHSAWVSGSTADFGPTINGSCPQYNTTSGRYINSAECSYTLSPSGAVPNFGSANWGGCVMARPAPYDVTDDVPATGTSGTMFQMYNFLPVPDPGEYNYNPWETTSNSRTTTTTTYNFGYDGYLGVNAGPNALCSQQITQMTATSTTILNALNTMTAAGDTDLDLGMVWGWRMLSPNWQGLWGGEMNNTGNTQFPQLPLPYNTALMQKVVVFMTDGMDRFVPGDYSGYGFLGDNQLGTTSELASEETLDSRMLSVCTAMKNNGIIIYTIGFGNASPDNPPTESDRGDPLMVDTQLLQSCATQIYPGDTSHFFLAPTNATLQSAFTQIGSSLANLRVSQ